MRSVLEGVIARSLVPGIHVFGAGEKQDVDGRDKPGHDEMEAFA